VYHSVLRLWMISVQSKGSSPSCDYRYCGKVFKVSVPFCAAAIWLSVRSKGSNLCVAMAAVFKVRVSFCAAAMDEKCSK
jgi:hypothetical protein